MQARSTASRSLVRAVVALALAASPLTGQTGGGNLDGANQPQASCGILTYAARCDRPWLWFASESGGLRTIGVDGDPRVDRLSQGMFRLNTWYVPLEEAPAPQQAISSLAIGGEGGAVEDLRAAFSAALSALPDRRRSRGSARR